MLVHNLKVNFKYKFFFKTRSFFDNYQYHKYSNSSHIYCYHSYSWYHLYHYCQHHHNSDDYINSDSDWNNYDNWDTVDDSYSYVYSNSNCNNTIIDIMFHI